MKNEHFILALMYASTKPLYGAQIERQVSPHVKRGSIYVVLTRMGVKGYIASYPQLPSEGEQGPPRRMYILTSEGRNCYEAWFREHKKRWGWICERAPVPDMEKPGGEV